MKNSPSFSSPPPVAAAAAVVVVALRLLVVCTALLPLWVVCWSSSDWSLDEKDIVLLSLMLRFSGETSKGCKSRFNVLIRRDRAWVADTRFRRTFRTSSLRCSDSSYGCAVSSTSKYDQACHPLHQLSDPPPTGCPSKLQMVRSTE